MGVSFKISKTGTKFKPKPVISDPTCINGATQNSQESSRIPSNHEPIEKDDAVGTSVSSLPSGKHQSSTEDAVSFTLNLYPDGYSIGKPSENDIGLQAGFKEDSKLLHPYDRKLLHPYDRTSEGFFAAIESGRLPGGILDDLPCKYVEGTLICEVRDFRKCMPGSGSSISSINGSATITKVNLKMSLENVVKDIPVIADDSWTYGDLMEVESRILKVLQPKLCLDPSPRLDRLCESPVSSKLNLGLVGRGKRRLRQPPEVIASSNYQPRGKKVCIDRASESSSYRIGEFGPSGDMLSQHVQDNAAAQGMGPNDMLSSMPSMPEASFPALNSTSQLSEFQAGPGNPRNMRDPMQSPAMPGVSSAGQDIPTTYAENTNQTSFRRMESQGQPSSYLTHSKRARLDGVQAQQIGAYMDGTQGSDVQWGSPGQQQPNARGIQYANNPGMQRYPQLVAEGVASHGSIKLEKADANMVKSDVQMMETEASHMDLRQRIQQNSFIRPAFQQANWANLSHQVEKDPRKEDQYLKRKSIQSPRLSAGNAVQSPLSAKSAEVSCGSMGNQYGATVASAAPLGQLQRDKSAVTSIPAVDRTASLTSSANDTMQPQHQPQLSAKRRSNSFSKAPAMSGVGSPVSVSNVSGPMNASSPSSNTPQLTEQSMLERFAKIEVVAMRHQLNCKKIKADEVGRKRRAFPAKELSVCLTNADADQDYVKDDSCTRPMSESLVGGSMNVCKIRVLTVQKQTLEGNMVPVYPIGRMILSEKPNDGTIAMLYGDLENADYMNVEDRLPTLPNTHHADLLASQFCALMIDEGYYVDDHVQPRPSCISIPSNSQLNAPGVTANNMAVDTQQYSQSVGQEISETKPVIGNASLNLSSNVVPSSGMVGSGSSQALQISQGLVSGVSMPARSQQIDPQQVLQQQPPQQPPQQQLPVQNQPALLPQQQQQPQLSRSPLMLPTNSMAQLNNSFGQSSSMPLGSPNHMVGNNKPSLQFLQQQQQQQVPQMQRRMMMGLGQAGMGGIGSMANNVVGLGNVMGIGGGARAGGMSATGISAAAAAPMGSMGANLAQNSMGMNQVNAIGQRHNIRAGGALNPAQAQAQAVMLQKLMMQRGMLGGNQAVVSGGIPGGGVARQMQPGSAAGLSMLGQPLNRGNLTSMQQRTAMGMGQMGGMSSKLIPGMNVPMTQQLVQQLKQQQQQQQMQQPQQQQQQQQEATSPSPLQASMVSLSPQQQQQVGSPSTLGIPQQQHMNHQASPQQMAQRTPMNAPLSSGPMHPMSASAGGGGGGNPDACPASPALSSQTLGSVGSITNSPMDLQGVNKTPNT